MSGGRECLVELHQGCCGPRLARCVGFDRSRHGIVVNAPTNVIVELLCQLRSIVPEDVLWVAASTEAAVRCVVDVNVVERVVAAP